MDGKENVVVLGGLSCKVWGAFRAGRALVPALCLVSSAASGDLAFTPPQFFPGDSAIGPAAGMQQEADIARGGSQFLAVWSDYRTSLDDYPPFLTEGTGSDIYGTRLDSAGNVLDASPLAINQEFGDQLEPRVAWNGENWLVTWKRETPTLPTYEMVVAVRVAPDGTVLDSSPIVVHNNQSYYSDLAAEGSDSGWVVLFQASGPTDGLTAVRIAADGTVATPGGLLIHSTTFLLDFDLAFATDQYLIAWGGVFDMPRGQRFTPDLQPIETAFALPFFEKVASDGTDFLIVWASGSPPAATVEAVRVTHDGSLPDPPFTIFTAGGQAGTCCADVVWDGMHYWTRWGQLHLARVTADGQVIDPGGFEMPLPDSWPISSPRFDARPSGGVQLIWNNGVRGAAYPKDVYSGQVGADRQLENETLVSRGAPAQIEADFAEGDGIHLLTFRSRTSRSARILVQRIDSEGVALDPEPIEVATGPVPGEGLPSIGAPGVAWNGSLFMVTWSDGLNVYARRLLADGTFVDASPLTIMGGFDPDVAALGEVFLVVGVDFLFGNPEWQATHSMRVDGTTGLNLDPEPNALGGFAIFARYPHVVTFGNRWLAVWQRNLSHNSPIAGTTAAFIDADGTTPGIFDPPLAWRPDVAVSGDRALFVAVTNTVASATTDLAGIIMLANGSLVGDPFLISSAPDKQLNPAVTWNGWDFIVVWEDKRNSVIHFDERTDLYGARVSSDGAVLDPDGVAIAATSVPEIDPALLAIGSTTLLAASTFRPDPPLGAYRVGVQVDGGTSTGIGDRELSAAPGVRLMGARPNPANPSTTIRFEYGGGAPVDLRIFDVGGRLVRTLLSGRVVDVGDGALEVTWDGRDDNGRSVDSGVFFYELRTPTGSARERLVILK